MKIASNKASDVVAYFRKELEPLYGKGETEAFVRLCFEEYLGTGAGTDGRMSESDLLKFSKTVKELKAGKPLQYILGKADFYGMRLKADERALIPRPETEELVDWIVKDHPGKGKGLRILDIGTGSGCIAIALKKHLPEAEVIAIDFSEQALELARENAEINNAKIELRQTDILANDLTPNRPNALNIIVSNPPYVTRSERKSMARNVLEHEPSLALFVPDDDPLLFYRAIAGVAGGCLEKAGRLYFEFGLQQRSGLKELLLDKGFRDIETRVDSSGRERMLRALH